MAQSNIAYPLKLPDLYVRISVLTTKEFCGNKKVHRKTCPKTNGTPRVVGYFEGWAQDRPCNVFWPEQIPDGLYTHINFAFATIDPKTFKVGPSAPSDVALIRRLMVAKKRDPNLKIYVAIGGWTFNDDGPTKTTFSDLAASVPRQKIFMESLISFMATYGFDGVDLDWEYPQAKDRFGRDVDYVNFPKFMERLKTALDTVNKGITITIPASYWYLQHFDIKKLAKSIEFFNFMSYDLHGLWDKDKKWTGSFLNAHTNLTEIDLALDLLWRNDIDPGQVVLGLGFYGRAFTAASKTCMEPGCMFSSGGERGDCSREVGILLNSEIEAMVNKHGVTPKLYKREAVKVATWNDQWVAYDDEETLKMKSEFAQSRCLGGLMVWAISHDTEEAKYNLVLATVASRKVRRSGEDAFKFVDIPNEQCKWTNCQQSCPKGWIHMNREDPNARKGEKMLDETGCGGDGTHSFCCPPNSKMPTCGWYGHGNGNCKSSCPDGQVEIGSNNMHCKKKNYQAACCTVGSKNMRLYTTCEWGTYPNCDDQKGCPKTSADTLLAESFSGTGGGQCDWLVNKLGEEYGLSFRKYCCDTSKEKVRFGSCKAYDTLGPEPANAPLGFCRSGCPEDRVRVALDSHPLHCTDGAMAVCCTPGYNDTIEVENPKLQEFRDAVKEYTKRPVCTNPGPLLSKRGDLFDDFLGSEEADASVNTSLAVVENFAREVDNGGKKTEELLFLIIAKSGTDAMISTMIEIWNGTMGKLFPNLHTSVLLKYLEKLGVYKKKGPKAMSHSIICHPSMWNARIGAEKGDGGGKTALIDCSEHYCPYESECIDPDADLPEVSKRSHFDSHLVQLPYRSHRHHHHEIHRRHQDLFKRAGASNIAKTLTAPEGEGTAAVSYRRPAYYSERELAADDPLRDDAFSLLDEGDCSNTGLQRSHVDPPETEERREWDMEHLVDPNRLNAFMRDAIQGLLPDGSTSIFGRVSASFFRNVQTMDLGNEDDGLPALPGGANPPRLFDRVAECLGSQTNRGNFVILTTDLNWIKGNLMQFHDPIKRARWDKMTTNFNNESDRNKILQRIRNAIAMIHYLNRREGTDINQRLANIVNCIEEQLRHAQNLYNQNHPNDQVRVADFWRSWSRNQFVHLVTHTQRWGRDLIQAMRRAWGVSTHPAAQGVLETLNTLEVELDTLQVDLSRFRMPPPN
ncbi:hypothetical protein CEP52_011197 [Fusarium oligoseptatum]|uniref:chitinase n=1 Tax=Fusarium oligoseptatum TaxID=2604345 RepID=A0A428T4H4_9HYPO|nr:hypothetical protein CEP52_011197 [Fusarium oligoseptatum]